MSNSKVIVKHLCGNSKAFAPKASNSKAFAPEAINQYFDGEKVGVDKEKVGVGEDRGREGRLLQQGPHQRDALQRLPSRLRV